VDQPRVALHTKKRKRKKQREERSAEEEDAHTSIFLVILSRHCAAFSFSLMLFAKADNRFL
jgi:hypothetical protein